MKYIFLVSILSLTFAVNEAYAEYRLSLSITTADSQLDNGCLISSDQVDLFSLSSGPWQRMKTQYTKELPNSATVEELLLKYNSLSSDDREYKSRPKVDAIDYIELLAGFPLVSYNAQRPSEGNGSAPGPGNLKGFVSLKTNNSDLENLVRFAFINCRFDNPAILSDILDAVK